MGLEYTRMLVRSQTTRLQSLILDYVTFAIRQVMMWV